MAAGLGFKDFVTGEVLTASDLDGYLMQNIWVFASTAARDAAVTAPAEGNFAFTKDTDSLWYYNGSAWVASGATGDIEGVTAGVGISGGGTSGTVTVTNSMATAIDAKGDLIVGTGADTFSKLTAGTNGYLLTADSAEATGLKWAAPAGGGGKVLQVVQASTTTTTTITSLTYTDSTITATITPSAATSKILVLVNAVYYVSRTSGARGVNQKLLRGATDIQTLGDKIIYASATDLGGLITQMYLDSPSTTSATTYKTQNAVGDSTSNSHTVVMQINNMPSTITLIEIGA